jgi:hypothetical protein
MYELLFENPLSFSVSKNKVGLSPIAPKDAPSLVKYNKNNKFRKELICLLSLHCLIKMSFALKPAFAPT